MVPQSGVSLRDREELWRPCQPTESLRVSGGVYGAASVREAAPEVRVYGDSVDVVLCDVYAAEFGSPVHAARALLDRTGEAEEVVQEAFARIYLAWQKKGVPERPVQYVRAAVYNLARNGLRRRILRRSTPGEIPPDHDLPEGRAVASDDMGRVNVAIRSLPERQRACVVMRHYLDASVDETAKTIGISAGSVKTHTHRGLNALRAALEQT